MIVDDPLSDDVTAGTSKNEVTDETLAHDATSLREQAKRARAIAHKRKKDGDTRRLLIALADNFERLAELAEATKDTAQHS
jgi:hypothetical protein